ncbi:MAG: hypothetical protein [Caudoviricetes sp.]|nr:MAG: hypothetical protein [Caudoviricetes sp.]
MKYIKKAWKYLWFVPTTLALFLFILCLLLCLGPRTTGILLKDWGDSWAKFH